MKEVVKVEVETTQKGMTALDKFEVEYPEVEVNSNEEAMDFLLYKETELHARNGDKELCDALEKEMVAEDRRMTSIISGLITEIKEEKQTKEKITNLVENLHKQVVKKIKK